MDFIGNVGYLYMVRQAKQHHFVANVISPLVIPHHVHTLSTLKRTLDVMFRMKVCMMKESNFSELMLQQQQQIDDAFNRISSRFNNIVTRMDLQHDPIRVIHLAFGLFGASDLDPQINLVVAVRRLLAARGHFGGLVDLIDDEANHQAQVPEELLDDEGWRRLCTMVHITVASLAA